MVTSLSYLHTPTIAIMKSTVLQAARTTVLTIKKFIILIKKYFSYVLPYAMIYMVYLLF